MSTRLNGGEFVTKVSELEHIFTMEDFSDEQNMMAESGKEFIDREVAPLREAIEKKDTALIENLGRKVGELGFLGVSIPEQYGGMGMGFSSAMVACDFISGGSGSLATLYGAHTGIGTMPIYLYGNEEQKQKYLPKLCSGEWFASYCLTEPGAGSDANSGKTKAVLSEDGTHYKITGQKMWITNAGFADLFIVFARIEDDKNITGFILEKSKAVGLSFGEEEHKLGIRSSSTRQVFFDNTEIPVENILGERNGGFKIAVNALNVGRIKLAAGCLDAQRRTLTTAIKYANERKQFNIPISSFGAIKQKIANMATNLFVSESGTYRGAMDIEKAVDKLVESGVSHQEAELKGIEEYAIEASILKVYVSEAIQSCADEGIAIFGGMGFSEDAPMETAWRDARIGRIYEGTNEINRLLSVGMLVKRAFQGRVDLIGPAMKVGEELMGIPSFSTPDYSALFSEEKAILENCKKIFLMLAGAGVQKFGKDLEKNQELILCAAEILKEIYMAESTIFRAEKASNANAKTSAKVMVEMAQLNLYKAVEIIERNAKKGIVSVASGDEQKMMLNGLKRFTKYSNYPNVIALEQSIAQWMIDNNQYLV
ncbi:MAG: acyl-CoA dehydrogenase [Flavobacteriaceae bacterium]|nr:MAG: acyl-CoA dehydrogenase [Flavobacteriaceae bacterium]